MKVDEKLFEFLRDNLSLKKANYYTTLLESMSGHEFDKRLKECTSEIKYHKEKTILGPLGRVDDEEAMLLIIQDIIDRRIKTIEKVVNLASEKVSFIGTCDLGSEVSKRRSNITLMRERMRVSEWDLRKITKELEDRIEKRLVTKIELILKNKSFVNKADFAKKTPGYIFYFYEGHVYLAIWDPRKEE